MLNFYRLINDDFYAIPCRGWGNTEAYTLWPFLAGPAQVFKLTWKVLVYEKNIHRYRSKLIRQERPKKSPKRGIEKADSYQAKLVVRKGVAFAASVTSLQR